MLKEANRKVFESDLDKALQNVIILNIGGQLFQTTKITLKKYDSLFKEILSGKINMTQIPEKTLFFDRDPTYFHLILNYFRTGMMPYPCDPSSLQALRAEINFYQIKNLIQRYKFNYENVNDRNGILYYLGIRNKYSFENPVDSKEIELYFGEQYNAYIRSKLLEIPLKNLLDFDEKINEEKPVFATKSPKEPFLIIRFKGARVNPNLICLENIKGEHLDFMPSDLAFYGAITENLIEGIKSKEIWVLLESKFKEEKLWWRNFEILSDDFFNTIKIENVSLSQNKVTLSGIEIYGSLTEKN